MSESTHPPRNANTTPRSRWLMRVGVQCVAILATFAVCIAMVGLAQRIGWIQSPADSAASDDQQQTSSGRYTCPMHPEIQQDTPGRCPICGMELTRSGGDESEGASRTSAEATPPAESSDTESGAGQVQYVCPMMCAQPQSEPGRCPVCGMELARTSRKAGDDARSVSISAADRRIIGIRTAEATREEVERSIRAVGRIEYDEQQVATIAAYFDGRIEELYAEYEGVSVDRGDHLALLYSPELYSAQVAYLSSLRTPALDAMAGGDDRLSEVARDNLVELGLTNQQIESLRTSGRAEKRMRIASPITGTVITKHKVEGDYVRTGEPIYRVADLSMVWLMIQVFPRDAAAMRFGQQVEVEVQSLPGVVYTGRVAFVDPLVDRDSRTIAVRVEMSNVDGKLRPGDYATARVQVPAIPRDQIYDPALAGKWISPMHPQIIRNQPGTCPICEMPLVSTESLGYVKEPLPDQTVVTVPRSAVLTGGEHAVVYVETKPGVFTLREVAIAATTESQVVIAGGVEEGEMVAVDGNFLIDSQMQLSGNPSLIDPSKDRGGIDASTTEAGHAH